MKKSGKIGSYEDACKALGFEPLTIDSFSNLPEWERQLALSTHRIRTVIRAKKVGKKTFDWNNRSQPKHFPWWDMETYRDNLPRSGFSLDGVDCAHTSSGVGAALCSHSEGETKEVAKMLKPDYEIMMKTE